MTNKTWEHWELCEKYYEVFGEYVPFELAFETVEDCNCRMWHSRNCNSN